MSERERKDHRQATDEPDVEAHRKVHRDVHDSEPPEDEFEKKESEEDDGDDVEAHRKVGRD